MSLKETTYPNYPNPLVVIVPTAEKIGLNIQRTEGQPQPKENIKDDANILAIIEEAERLGTIREIPIDDKRSIVVATTISASPHTPLTVPYQIFNRIWREEARQCDYNPVSGDLLAIVEEKRQEAQVPTHFINWATLKEKNDDGRKTYRELDIFDLVGQGKRYDKKTDDSKPRNFTLDNLDEETRKKVLKEFWNELTNRMTHHNRILLRLYNEGIKDRILSFIENLQGQDLGLQSHDQSLLEEIKKLLVSVFADPGFPDHSLPVGHYSLWREDGLGRGPQSNPNFHSHNAIYFLPEKLLYVINKIGGLNDDNKQNLFYAVLEKFNLLFPGRIARLQDVYSDKEKWGEILMKQVDPYSTIVFQKAKKWLLTKIKKIMEENKINFSQADVFIHHTTQDRIADERWAEGVKISLPQDKLPDFLNAFNYFLMDLYQIWFLVKQMVDIKKNNPNNYLNYPEYTEMENQLRNMGIPDGLISLIHRLVPVQPKEPLTEKHLNFSPKKPYAEFAIKEITAEPSSYKGYNIPGVPALGLTFEFMKGVVVIRISPLLSLKGLAEQITGIPVIR
jgi:hypothetical protein